MRNQSTISILVALLACSSAVAAVKRAESVTPAEVVSRIVVAPHGLTSESGPQVAALLERIRRNPAPYLPSLLAYLDRGRSSATDEQLQQAIIAASILVRAGGPAGRAALATKLTELYATLDALQQQIAERGRAAKNPRERSLTDWRRRISRLQKVVIAIMQEFITARDPRLRDIVLPRLEKENYTLQISYIRYFDAALKNDAVVRERLRGLLRSKESNFYNSPWLKQILASPAPNAEYKP